MSVESDEINQWDRQTDFNVEVAQALLSLTSAMSQTIGIHADVSIHLVKTSSDPAALRDELFPSIKKAQSELDDALKRLRTISELLAPNSSPAAEGAENGDS